MGREGEHCTGRANFIRLLVEGGHFYLRFSHPYCYPALLVFNFFKPVGAANHVSSSPVSLIHPVSFRDEIVLEDNFYIQQS